MKTTVTFLILFLISNTFLAQSASLPYYTGFDSPAQQAGWQQFRKGAIGVFDWVDNGNIFHDYNVGGASTDTMIDWYVSPPINFSSPAVMTMKMYASGFSTPTPDNCEVYFGTDDPDPAIGNFVLIGNMSVINPLSQWLDTVLDIPYTSDSGYVAFKYKTIGSEWMIYSFDSITISANVGIDQLANLNHTAVTVSPNPFNTSATINFDAEVQNGRVEIYNVQGQKVKSLPNINGREFNLDREELPIGVYTFVLMQDDKLLSTKKFVISN